MNIILKTIVYDITVSTSRITKGEIYETSVYDHFAKRIDCKLSYSQEDAETRHIKMVKWYRYQLLSQKKRSTYNDYFQETS